MCCRVISKVTGPERASLPDLPDVLERLTEIQATRGQKRERTRTSQTDKTDTSVTRASAPEQEAGNDRQQAACIEEADGRSRLDDSVEESVTTKRRQVPYCGTNACTCM